MRIYRFVAAAVMLVLVVVDQLTKWMAEKYLAGKAPFVLMEGVFELSFLRNPGAAFGMLQGQRTLLLVVTTIALAALAFVFFSGRLGHTFLALSGGTLVLAGGVGNMIDRVFRHEVIDFLYFKLINFPVFNAADCFVVVGSGILVFYFLFTSDGAQIWKESSKADKPAECKGEGDVSCDIGNADLSSREDGRQA